MISFHEVNGLKMSCWVSQRPWRAERRTLVFIHGSGGDHTAWLHQCTRLKDAFNIAALDLPGHGRSEGRGEQDVAVYVEWVRQILEALAIEKPVLIGHSLGAAISLCYALTYGDKLAGIVPVGGGAVMPVNPAILEGLKTDPATVIAMAAKISVAKSNRDRLSKILMKSMSGVNPDILYGDFLACDTHDVTATSSRIRVPALVICGDEDKMTPPDMSRYLADSIPGAQWTLIRNSGHFVMLENVEEFNKILSTFVESLPT
ncbi:MAG: alpha/beta hydrolase [Pseudomonadota bacterium]